ncbi:glutaminyl-peptide cyclotransferase [Jejuia pallidilutea]|uniref:Glutamine cyclotransferase n=1 Tax=Jejuia pallidilutea TaxID=504487 RepID=A0A090VLU7_9FLAO|nr:glutaminyl-peptide cyclotransferase [Jejuia pallidilutea]GAL65701.1 glutamine cyclotransferase [Jejuia pallidilutea]GAL72399.1 glutamine cyclotransferase [Jejuia pallidilutea]GAL88630.1 glutamine cyclotransferase [Jejuia pallidilutea]
MKTYKQLTLIALLFLLVSCGSNSGQKKDYFSIVTNAEKGNISIKETLKLSLENKKKHTIDSVIYKLDGKTISDSYALNNHKLGKHPIEALVYFNGEHTQTITSSITILNDASPKIYKYRIINEYPHDITSYTQGLEFYNGKLYESTGQYKESKLRQVDYKTGTVIKNVNLADAYFGEGLTIVNDKIYQLTWKAGVGLVYDVQTLEKTGSFKYGKSKEGWGLTHNNSHIYKSDGSENIWLLNPETLTEEDNIQVYTNKGKITEINEMEWINGKIYANRYQKNGVAIINPKNGAVEGVIDFTPLKNKVTQHEKLDVLNGIAYNTETKTIFVTGKRWDKLFEVEILE